jgi:hypothetical protein
MFYLLDLNLEVDASDFIDNATQQTKEFITVDEFMKRARCVFFCTSHWMSISHCDLPGVKLPS